MLNNRLRHTALAAALPLLLAACQSDELPAPGNGTPGNNRIAFTVEAETATTRSYPYVGESNKEGAQHVKNVRLYIFQGSGDEAAYEGAENATPWSGLDLAEGDNPVAGDDAQGGKVTTSKYYYLQTTLAASTTYTLLAVGYEDKDIYDIRTAATSGNSLSGTEANTPTSLSSLVSTLTGGNGKTDIASHEYFTGTATVTTDGSGNLPGEEEGGLVTIAMRRRVAGVGACFHLKDFTTRPKAVAVMLWQDQNKAVPTLRKDWQEPDFTDYTDSHTWEGNRTGANDPQCILYIPLDQQAADGTTSIWSDANGEYTMTAPVSAYVLPAPAPSWDNKDKNYTLCVAVYNTEGKIICTKRAALAEDGQLIFNSSLGTGIIDDESFYRYPLVANRFYRFGTAKAPLTVDYDKLNPFEVVIEPNWEGMPDLDLTTNSNQ